MARIRLAHWHDGHAPGDVVEVPGDQVAPLRRDGRVAEVLDADGDGFPPAGPSAVADAAADAVPEPEAAAPAKGRPRKGVGG